MARKKKRKGADSHHRSPQGEKRKTRVHVEEPDEAVEAGPPRTLYDSVRENAEALVVAVLLAIVIRHFAVEAFEIPTGSMAPTLYGMHLWTVCPNCDTEFPVGLHPDSRTGELQERFYRRTVYDGPCANEKCGVKLHFRGPQGTVLRRGGRVECQACGTRFYGEPSRFRTAATLDFDARCPNCQFAYRAVVERDAVRNGNKILVNKFAYAAAPPHRWDVIVFEFDQWKNYIKRLIGLPGETIQIYDGDIYVNGKVSSKGDHPYIQREMWRPISDSDVVERGLQRTPAWEEVGREGSGAWSARQDRTRWSLNAASRQEPAYLEYRRGFDNYVNYNIINFSVGGAPDLNARGYTTGIQVGDKKVAFRVTPLAPGGWIGARIRDGDYTFLATLPVGKPSARRPAVLERVPSSAIPAGAAAGSSGGGADGPSTDDGFESLRAESPRALPWDVATLVEFENVDDRVAVRLDGEEILVLHYVSCPDPNHPPSVAAGEKPQGLWLLGASTRATFESIRVWRDLYYLNRIERPQGRPRHPWEGKGIRLKEGEFLALGDNTASSSDGRFWGYVPAENLMGKALLVFWPAWPLDFQCKFIR